MTDSTIDFGPGLRGLALPEWMTEVEELVDYDGYLAHLGDDHLAAFSEHGKTLLVTFESFQGIQAMSPKAHPLGWELVKTCQWSCLSLISDGNSWFRTPYIYAFFDRLVDDGFFDEFDEVLFYGAGPCGYAAAAFSVSSPGARVLAIQPQATLAPNLTEWDNRFPEQRKHDFTSRYGYAPDMLEAARQGFVVYDPKQLEDAMHASLFIRPNVTRLRTLRMGASLQMDMLQMSVLFPLIEAAGEGNLTRAKFGSLMRARRDHPAYLRRVLSQAEEMDRPDLIRSLCRNVTDRMNAPRFAKRLESLNQELA